jgi:hypothetical protein
VARHPRCRDCRRRLAGWRGRSVGIAGARPAAAAQAQRQCAYSQADGPEQPDHAAAQLPLPVRQGAGNCERHWRTHRRARPRSQWQPRRTARRRCMDVPLGSIRSCANRNLRRNNVLDSSCTPVR